MNHPRLVAWSALALVAVTLRADPAADRKIEAAAAESYNLRRVLHDEVQVKVTDGVATLSGTVLDREQRELAEETVRHLPGVTGIDNQLDVVASAPDRADGWLVLKIRSILLLRRNVSVRTTDVSVVDGVVTLTGSAETEEQRQLTETYVRSVEGVKGVHNRLRVEPLAAGEGDRAAPGRRETVDDASITAQVRYALLTSHSADAAHTRVETRGGVVTLRGYVGSDAERQQATRLAETVRGVTLVVNEMTVEASE